MLIFEKMLIFLILMLVGLLLVRVRIIDDRTNRKLSAIVLYVANPALIINASQADNNIPGSELLTTALVAGIMFAVLIAVALVLPKLFRLEQKQENAYAVMTVFSNIGYLGIPLVSEIFGAAALLYVSVFILLFNVLIYTYGVMILQRGMAKAAPKRFDFGKFVNPGVLSSIVAVSLYLLRVRLPHVLLTPLEYLSNLTAPISMMIIGATLAHINIRSFFTDYKLLLFSLIKLLLLPILCGFAFKHFIGGGDLLGVCIVVISAPVGSMTVMMAQQYGGDCKLLTKGITLTTLLCIVTIPIVFAVLL